MFRLMYSVVMTTATVDQIYAQAAEKAAANPPGRVLATVVLAVFTAIGWVLGTFYTGLWFSGMALMYGIRQGNRVPEKAPAPEPVPAPY